MKKGLVVFHQGFTDIVNHLSLMTYYSGRYDLLEVFIRKEVKDLFDFYCRNITNLKINYVEKGFVDSLSFINEEKFNEYDFLFHGFFDSSRKDNYKLSFNEIRLPYIYSFYVAYDIPLQYKIEYFNLERDTEKEKIVFEEFILKNGINYILYDNNQIDYIKNKMNCDSDCVYVNLNLFYENPFHLIKVLQNAKEIHVLDSMWGSIIYLIHSKYNLLCNPKVFYYPFEERCGGIFCDTKTFEYFEIDYENKFHPKEISEWKIMRIEK